LQNLRSVITNKAEKARLSGARVKIRKNFDERKQKIPQPSAYLFREDLTDRFNANSSIH